MFYKYDELSEAAKEVVHNEVESYLRDEFKNHQYVLDEIGVHILDESKLAYYNEDGTYVGLLDKHGNIEVFETKQDNRLGNHYIFYNLERNKYSVHTTIESLSDELIDSLLSIVSDCEYYKGEYFEKEREWQHASVDKLITLIQKEGYEILEVTGENITRYEKYYGKGSWKVGVKNR